jgi:hypothetical protein
MTDRAQLDADHSKAFMLGGNARVTLESQSTGARFTYRIRAAEDGGLYFVSVLTGADNESDFAYLGTIRGDRFEHGRKARLAWTRRARGPSPGLGRTSPPVRSRPRSASGMKAAAGAATAR